MVGTARKKLNSAAIRIERPCCIPPTIEAADLLVPGIIAKHCQNPIVTAFLVVTSCSLSIFELLKNRSIKSKTIPPTIKTIAIGTGF
jgi:hypothetical protein